jgi:hypothetical protein
MRKKSPFMHNVNVKGLVKEITNATGALPV